MANRKVSYKNLLKQAISEYDTSKTVQVKGPMLDPILSWDGDGELPIYKDAASILERYYFNENAEDPIMVPDLEDLDESEYNEDGTEAKTASMKHGEGPGTQQAGTSSASNIKGDLKDQEEDIAKEDVEYEEDDTTFAEDTLADDIELFFSEQDDEAEPEEDKTLDVDQKMGEKEGEEAAEKDEEKAEEKDEKAEEKDEEVEESADLTEDAENAVIEKLIDEMEEVDEAEMTYSGEGPKDTGKKVMTYDKEGPAPGMEAPDEKKAKSAEEDTKGAGTDQAGTGPAEGQIPPRKDVHDQMVKPKSYTAEGDLFDLEEDLDMEALELLGLEEELDAELADAEEGLTEKEWSGKDVPKKKEYHDEQSAVPGGPSPHKAGPEAEDWDEGQAYEESAMKESFELFKEAIKEDDDEDDKIIV